MQAITFQDVLQTQQTANELVGARAVTPDGRIWRYIQSTVAMAIGNISVPVAVTAVGTTITSGTNGNGQIVFINKAAAGWTPGQYIGGFVHVNAGTGQGQIARIRGNSGSQLILQPEYALTTALDVTSTVNIWTQYLTRLSVVTTKIQNTTGIAQVAFAANDYGWVLERGQGVVTSDTAGVVGKDLVAGGTTAGFATLGTTANGPFDQQQIAVTISAAGNNQNQFAYVQVN